MVMTLLNEQLAEILRLSILLYVCPGQVSPTMLTMSQQQFSHYNVTFQ